ncbi:MAG: hypothetical protein WCU00_04145 [Candidatus Latescibacterota bacterium]|jgi:hypothetical protein
MFITLLIVTFVVSFAVCFIVATIFRDSLTRIMQRLVADDLSKAWSRYIIFAIYVVGISGGVRIWEMEKFISGNDPSGKVIELTSDRWVLEVYRTVIGTLQSDAWMLLVFFIFALIAYVIVKGLEGRKQT